MDKTIGKYRILRELGKGGMAMVYRALEPETQKIVALKVLFPTMVDSSSLERFNHEIRAMSRLRHPNILAIYDSGASKGHQYFAMELVEGRSLKARIKQSGALPVRDALDIAAQAAEALAYAHN